MTTIISLSKNVNELPEVVTNWEDISEEAKNFMLSGTHFRAHNPQELLIFNERQIIASCSIHCFNDGDIEIENCWTKGGQLQ